jgi:hypothetical protein
MDPVSIGLAALSFLIKNGPTIIAMIQGKTDVGTGIEDILGLTQTIHSVAANPSQPNAEATLNDAIGKLEVLLQQAPAA